MNTLGIGILAVIVFSIVFYIFYFIAPFPRKFYDETIKFRDHINGFVDYEKLSNGWNTEFIVCSDKPAKCLDDNTPLFYTTTGIIKRNTIFYFVNTSLTFNTGDKNWWQNKDNVEELYNKLNFGFYVGRHFPANLTRYVYLTIDEDNKFSQILETPYIFFR